MCSEHALPNAACYACCIRPLHCSTTILETYLLQPAEVLCQKLFFVFGVGSASMSLQRSCTAGRLRSSPAQLHSPCTSVAWETYERQHNKQKIAGASLLNIGSAVVRKTNLGAEVMS